MKKTYVMVYLLFSILLLSCNAANQKQMLKTKSLVMKFASAEEARELLTTEDTFTQAWSVFDIESRMGKAGSSKSDLLAFISEQAMEWSDEDRQKINAALKRIEKSIAELNLNLSLEQEVILVKTTAKEEGGAAGYTRGNYIVLSEAFKDMKAPDLDKLLVHELFHVISRSNPKLREKLYGLIGFKMMPEIAYPDVLKPLRITNPDATQTDSYIDLKVGDETVSCMMVLYAKGNYKGGSFFNYLSIGFLKVEGEETKIPVIGAEGPVIFGMGEVENFYEQVGRNTQYIIHPEEIMADNFAFAVLGKEDLIDENLVDQIRVVLRGNE